MKYFLYGLILVIILVIISFVILNHFEEPYELNDITRQSVNGNFIRLSRGMVRYEFAGDSSSELIVFLGGAGLGYEVWDNNFKYFQQAGYRVLRFDYYGRGFSDRVKGIELTTDFLSDQVIELMDTLGIHAPFYIISFSLGGGVTFPLMKKLPGRVNKAVLISPIGSKKEIRPGYYRLPVFIDLLMTFYWSPQAVNKQMSEFHEPELFPDFRKQLAFQMKFKGFKKSQLSLWLNALSSDVTSYIKEVGKSGTKFLLVWGSEDWRNSPLNIDYYMNNIDQIDLVSVENAGHAAQYEKPDKVNAAIEEFLRGN